MFQLVFSEIQLPEVDVLIVVEVVGNLERVDDPVLVDVQGGEPVGNVRGASLLSVVLLIAKSFKQFQNPFTDKT